MGRAEGRETSVCGMSAIAIRVFFLLRDKPMSVLKGAMYGFGQSSDALAVRKIEVI